LLNEKSTTCVEKIKDLSRKLYQIKTELVLIGLYENLDKDRGVMSRVQDVLMLSRRNDYC